jgi:hypothetical protein
VPATEQETEQSSNDELRAALEKAGDENDAAQGVTEDTDDEQETVKPKTAPSTKTEPEPDDDEDDEDTLAANREKDQALQFYRRITNPETAEQVLSTIAKRAGYELKNLNAEQRDAVVDEVEAVLRSELGDEFALLPAGLSKALNKIINGKVNAAAREIEGVKARLAQSEDVVRQAAVEDALTWAASEYPEFESKNKVILREMKKFPPSPNMNAREYIKRICKLVDVAPKQSVDNSRTDRARSNKDGTMPSDGVRKERSTRVANSLAEAAAMAYDEQFKD